ncbi:Gfo/Idh/MocA family oxidoreductase [Dactylosporangium sp. NPDC000244]|uniref:Gfo/Idh/MocA family protein n=1 Tax=Dactylosporangium sp. NPDC000244 TaxID=3154365 RepID=UPI0033249FCF
MSAPLRVGVLGCGSIAKRKALPSLVACPGTVVAAVASRDKDKAARYAAEFGGEPVGYEELLAHPGVDAVYLAVPTGLHHEWTRAALEAGKHVLAEKPLTTSAADTRELVELAAARGLVLRENFVFPHHAQHRAVRELLAAGRIGEPRSFDAVFCIPPLPSTDVRYSPQLGGGALLDLGVYPIRAAQDLFGELELVGACLREDPGTGVDVGGSALLVSAGGVMVGVRFGLEHAYGSWYTAWGSTGRLLLDRAFTAPAGLEPVVRITDAQGEHEERLPADDQFRRAFEAFAAQVREGRHEPDPATLRTAELVDEVRLSARRASSAGSPGGLA